MVRSLVTNEQRKLADGDSRPLHTASGHLVFSRGRTLFAAPFDIDQQRVTGTPASVLEGILSGQFDVSTDGLLVFVAQPRIDGRSLMWVNRDGTTEEVMPEARGLFSPG